MAEYLPALVEVASKLVDTSTAKQQVNAGEKVMEKVIEALASLGKGRVINKDTLLSAIDGLCVNKEFTLLRGQTKSVTIRFGTTRFLQSGKQTEDAKGE